MGLAGKVALVTGSTGGIGRAIARALARQGASIIIHGLGDPEKTERFRASLEAEAGVRVVFVDANLESADAAVRLIEDATKACGKVDILVNNAGMVHGGPIDTHPPDKWDAILAVNLSAPFHTIRTLSSARMRQQKSAAPPGPSTAAGPLTSTKTKKRGGVR
jgi:3-hydroxybutyrate dehydrogenase